MRPVADGTPRRRSRSSGFPFSPRQIAAGVILVLVVAFIVQNDQTTEIQLIVPTVETPLWLALLAMFAVGTLLGTLLSQRRPR